MPTLVFEGFSAIDTQKVTASKFSITGNFMFADGKQIGRYHNGFWEVNGKHYVSYKTESSVHYYFSDFAGRESPQFGPLIAVVANGSMRDNEAFIVRLAEPSQLWHHHLDDTYWSTMHFVD
jgi:hypothetical protein